MTAQINYFFLYGAVGFLLLIGQPMIEIIRNIYLDVTKSVEVVFIDTGRSKIVKGYRSKKTFIDKKQMKQYVCNENCIKNRKVFYDSNCGATIEFTPGLFKRPAPLVFAMDAEKMLYYVDSHEYAVKMNTNIFQQFATSKEIKFISYILYGVVACVVLSLMIAYKTGALSLGGGT